MQEDIMVSVLCTAYNHEKFIRDTIEGVLRQKTNFKYELIIHDDASSDRTADIIREYEKEYSDIIRPIIQKENQFQKCHINSTYLFPAARGKYIAFCEGDDYWIDENKLQKQIDFLEAHLDYSMCMHNAIRLNYETGEEQLLNTFEKSGTYTQEEQIKAGLGSNFPAFASYVIRTKFLQDIPKFFFDLNITDYPLRQYYANCGSVYYFEEPMSVYRVSTPNSYMKRASSNQEFYNNYTVRMIKFFEKFDIYTERRYQGLLKYKIDSDYMGFCLSINREDGIIRAKSEGMDIDKIEKIYERLASNYLHVEIKNIIEKSKSLYIYGISRIAPVCKMQLESAGIEYDGYIVSDGQMKPEFMEDKPVYFLSEVMQKDKNFGCILAVQPINMKDIENILRKYGVTNYCKPYLIND